MFFVSLAHVLYKCSGSRKRERAEDLVATRTEDWLLAWIYGLICVRSCESTRLTNIKAWNPVKRKCSGKSMLRAPWEH